ncbi:hypothetical protein KFE16_04540 [Clostridiaceae bacterium Marseille-Q4149]|jgi:hypothetical protein|nr:hypothetical protein KFE16_04540 [Clostridiaceae bacterium Marseille-Q4149]
MSIGLKVNDMVPSGMLGTQQWYSQPEMQQQLQLEMEVMKPHVGEIKWGVNVGTLPDGRMYWKIRQPIKAERANGRGTLYNSVYDIMLVYEPDHPKGKWGTSVHAYLKAPNDLTWLQSRVNRSPRTPKNIPHVLTDNEGNKYLCTAHYNDFGTSYNDPRGVPTAKTALLCAIKWLHNFECGLLSQEHWNLFQQHGRL